RLQQTLIEPQPSSALIRKREPHTWQLRKVRSGSGRFCFAGRERVRVYATAVVTPHKLERLLKRGLTCPARPKDNEEEMMTCLTGQTDTRTLSDISQHLSVTLNGVVQKLLPLRTLARTVKGDSRHFGDVVRPVRFAKLSSPQVQRPVLHIE